MSKSFIFTVLFVCFSLVSTSAEPIYPRSQIGMDRSPTPYFPMPGYLEPYTDTIYGTQVTRISDAKAFSVSGEGGTLKHWYSKAAAWNCDGSLIMLREALLNGNTYEFIKRRPYPKSRWRWSSKEPNKLFLVERNSFYSYNPRTDVRKTLKTFSEYEKIEFGLGEGNISIDDKYVALWCRKSDERFVVIYDIENNVVETTKKIAGTPYALDWVSMSPSGKYVILCWHGDDSEDRYRGTEAYDRNLNFVRQIHPACGHADLGFDVNENEVYVTGGYCDMVQLDNGKMTRLLPESIRSPSHVSCRNIGRPGWAYISTYSQSDDPALKKNRVFAVKLDGSGTVLHFAQTHCLGGAGGKNYWAEPQAVPNFNGTKVLYSSNWHDADGPVHTFVAEMPQNGPVQVADGSKYRTGLNGYPLEGDVYTLFGQLIKEPGAIHWSNGQVLRVVVRERYGKIQTIKRLVH